MDVMAATSDQDRGTLKRRLGRGLNALLGSSSADEIPESLPLAALGDRDEPSAVADESSVPSDEVALELIETNPHQPRKDFDEDGLEELAASIRQHGVLQPLLVRSTESGYQLIAGERRWRAAQRAQLATVPCRVLEMDDRGACEAAIEENLKRRDLNVLEKAEAFRDYLDHFGSTIEELAQHLSMNRSTVSNILRLLDLADPVREAVKADLISGGHARALLPLDAEHQVRLCQQIQAEGLSVRKTEQAVRAIVKPQTAAPDAKPAAEKPAPPQPSNHLLSLQDQLRERLGAKVEIDLKTRDSGRILIHFASNDDFERVIRALRSAG